jgi:DNA invertase Pin-like site-specific DNA recombinase
VIAGSDPSQKEKVFAEKTSGVVIERKALAKAIANLGEGDTLVVCKLDRLARSTRDLLNTLDAIGKAGATFKSLGDPWCDTTSTEPGNLRLRRTAWWGREDSNCAPSTQSVRTSL